MLQKNFVKLNFPPVLFEKERKYLFSSCFKMKVNGF